MSNRDVGGAPGTNSPGHQLPARQKRGSFTAWVAGLVVLAALVGGGVMYLNGNNRTTAAVNTTAVNAAPRTAPLTPETMPAPRQ